MEHGLYVLVMVASLYPILKLHLHQRTEPHQPRQTAWLKSIFALLARAFLVEEQDAEMWPTAGDAAEYAQDLCHDLEVLYEFLGLDSMDNTKTLFPTVSHVYHFLASRESFVVNKQAQMGRMGSDQH
jgi:hypothetical protein